MAYRTVCDADAKTPQDACAFITADSGWVVVATGKVKRVNGGWAVECFSCDGHAERTVPVGRIFLRVVSVEDAVARVIGPNKYEFSVPAVQPIIYPSFPGETITLTAGMAITCTIRPGTEYDIMNVFVDDFPVGTLKERREFNSIQPEELSWTPGVATGPGFNKQ